MKTIDITACSICAGIRNEEYAYSKYGSTDPAPAFSEGASRLEEFTLEGRRVSGVRSCPECGTLYSYESAYEYLTSGSEDEEWLRRMTPGEAARYTGEAERERITALFESKAAAAEGGKGAIHEYVVLSLAEKYIQKLEFSNLSRLVRPNRKLVKFIRERLAATIEKVPAEQSGALEDALAGKRHIY